MVPIKQMLLTPGKGGRPGRKSSPRGLVIHWTANRSAGADAIRHREYFENHPQNKVASHYVVDEAQIVQCIPEDEVAYHVGAKKYMPRALEILGRSPNTTTIGIEMCVNSDGDFAKTYRNTVGLAADILRRYGWQADKLWRHHDVTGKDCPRYFVDDATAREYGFENAAAGWKKFSEDVTKELKALEVGDLFKDIKGHWAQKDIERAAREGIIMGDNDGNFWPDRPATRAEIAVIAMRLEDRLLNEVKKILGK